VKSDTSAKLRHIMDSCLVGAMSLAAYRRSTACFASTSHTSAGKLRRPGPQSGALRTLLTPRAAQEQNSAHLSVGMMPSCAAHVQHVSISVHAYTFKEELTAVQLEGCWGYTAPSRNSWITGSRRHRSLPYGSTETSSGLRLRPALSPPRRLALTATQRSASAFCGRTGPSVARDLPHRAQRGACACNGLLPLNMALARTQSVLKACDAASAGRPQSTC